MMKRAIFLAAALLMLCAVIPQQQTQAQDLKIGYVDPQAILMKMPEMKAIQQRLKNFADRKRQELSDKQQNFQQQVQAYQQKATVISDEAKKKEQERLGKLNSQLQQFQSQIQQEMQKKQQELMGPLFKQIEDAIDSVANKQNLTYVLNTTTSSGDVIILYASDEAQQKYDITDPVMRQLGI